MRFAIKEKVLDFPEMKKKLILDNEISSITSKRRYRSLDYEQDSVMKSSEESRASSLQRQMG